MTTTIIPSSPLSANHKSKPDHDDCRSTIQPWLCTVQLVDEHSICSSPSSVAPLKCKGKQSCSHAREVAAASHTQSTILQEGNKEKSLTWKGGAGTLDYCFLGLDTGLQNPPSFLPPPLILNSSHVLSFFVLVPSCPSPAPPPPLCPGPAEGHCR